MKMFLVGLISISVAVVACAPLASEVTTQPATIGVTASNLYSEYEANEVAADQKYEDKILLIRGVILSIGKDILDRPYVVLGGHGEYETWGVQCMFDDEDVVAKFNKGQVITIKGKCSGYLINVLIEGCSLHSIP